MPRTALVRQTQEELDMLGPSSCRFRCRVFFCGPSPRAKLEKAIEKIAQSDKCEMRSICSSGYVFIYIYILMIFLVTKWGCFCWRVSKITLWYRER